MVHNAHVKRNIWAQAKQSAFLQLRCPLLFVSRRAGSGEGQRVAVINAAHFLLCDDVKNAIITPNGS